MLGRDKWLNKIKDTLCKHILKKKYPKWVNDNYNFEDIKFIWGIKSSDDISGSEANIWTMNDIEIDYDKSNKKYLLSFETIYHFDNGKRGEIKYLKRLLNAFTKYMIDNNYDIDEPLLFQLIQSGDFWTADSIPELYSKFKIFVNGYERAYLL